MNWEDMSHEQRARKEHVKVLAFLAMLLAAVLALHGCTPKPTPPPPVNPVQCDAACTAILKACPSSKFCGCSTIQDQSYAGCLLDASKKTDPCGAATACDKGH